jgi:GNAT superfamily N-acetyltransferase
MVLGDNSGQRVDGVRVTRVETFEEFAAGVRLTGLAFSMSAEEIAGTEAQLDDLWKDYLASDANQRWNAYLDGELVGTAGATSGDGGMNLFGGAVHPNGRGHGVYRALVQARWESAVEQGNPWLTVQAGRMSRPILERLGFSIVAEMPTYLDQF